MQSMGLPLGEERNTPLRNTLLPTSEKDPLLGFFFRGAQIFTLAAEVPAPF